MKTGTFKITDKSGSAKVDTYVEAQRRAQRLSTMPTHGVTRIFGPKGIIARFKDGHQVGLREQLSE